VVWWRYRGEDLSHVVRASKREIGKAFVIALPAIALPFVIRAAVVEGVATATEVSTIGIVYSVAGRAVDLPPVRLAAPRPMLVDTASLTGAIICSSSAARPPWPGA
jgi:TRAP-type C4-dicarboxylate transport system permease large subunit